MRQRLETRRSTIEATFTHFPGERFAQTDLAERLPRWLPEAKLRLARQLFRRSAVEHRHLVLPPDEATRSGRSFAKKNDLYRASVSRAVAALAEAISARVPSEALASVELLVTVSCTGFQIPAMDAELIPALGLRPTVRRVNLTQHGCSGGAQGLGLAHEWLQARPAARALVVSAEFCSLAFQPEDTSDENLVSAAIFGDGCAAVLLAGDEAEGTGAGALVRVVETHREFFPNTAHFMGFEVNDSGLKIKLSREVVDFSRDELRGLFARACDRFRVEGPGALRFGALHPGGRRILELLESDAGVPRDVTRSSWACLAQYGNLSSASVLVTLHETLKSLDLLDRGEAARIEGPGVVTAFGPGFGAELLLLERRARPAPASANTRGSATASASAT